MFCGVPHLCLEAPAACPEDIDSVFGSVLGGYPFCVWEVHGAYLGSTRNVLEGNLSLYVFSVYGTLCRLSSQVKQCFFLLIL